MKNRDGNELDGDRGFGIADCGLNCCDRNPKSAIRNPQSPRLAIRVASVVILGLAASSCTTESSEASRKAATQPSRMSDRQDAALKDPFGYSPNIEKTDISGGGLRNFDKDAFNKDVDHVLNP